MSWWKKLKHAVSKAADTVADTASSAAKTVANTTVDAANTVANTTVDVSKSIANDATKTYDATADASISAWETTSKEALAIGKAIESTGLTINKGILQGGQLADKWLEEGADYTYEGLVKAGNYLNQQACDIAVGAALGSIFASYEATDAQVSVFGSVVALCAFEAANAAAMSVGAAAVAAIIVDPVYEIPGVSKIGNKKLVTDVIAFVIFKCVKEDPEMTIGTGGQIIAGAIIAVLTTLFCEGALPGGFKVWQGTYRP